MKRKIAFLSALFITASGLCACSSEAQYENTAANDVKLEAAVEAAAPEEEAGDIVVAYKVENPQALPVHKSTVPTGDMTIRAGTLLNTGYSSEIGALVNGKLLTYQRVGNILYNFYYDDEFSEGTRLKSTGLKFSVLDCKENSSIPLTTITPLTDPYIIPALDGAHAFVVYTPLPEDVAPPKNIDELTELQLTLPLHVLRINVNTLDMTDFELGLPFEQLSEAYPVGSGYLLLHTSSVPIDGKSTSEILRILNLSTGELREFLRMDYTLRDDGAHVLPQVIITPVSASEDKIYFKTVTQSGAEKKYGFRIYDSDMNFMDGVDVMSFSGEAAVDYYSEMCVSNQSVFYKISSADGEEEYYHKFVPTTAGYKEAPFTNDSGVYDFKGMAMYTVNPRNSTDFDFALLQISDSRGGSYLSLSNPVQNTYYPLGIEIPGFVRPMFVAGTHEVTTDYDGGIIIRSYGSDYYNNDGIITPFNYYYISKEEMCRALYGDNCPTLSTEAFAGSATADDAAETEVTAIIPE